MPARLVTALRRRQPGRLDWPLLPGDDPGVEALVDASARYAHPWLGGGEPTTRADLPHLLRALRAAGHRPGLDTDGLALQSPAVVAVLVAAGLDRLRVRLHSARTDAHDWLEDKPGAARAAMRAISTAAAAGLPVEVEATLTRPTADGLAELALLVGRLGARSLLVRGLEPQGPALVDPVALFPRHSLLGDPLRRTDDAARSIGLRLRVEGLLACVGVEVSPIEPWAWAGSPAFAPAPRLSGCARCPGPTHCPGPLRAYVDLFGMDEHPAAQARPREGRLRVAFSGHTRADRQLAVRAGQRGATTLAVADPASLALPDLGPLLRELGRMGQPTVELGGPLDRVHIDERSLLALRGQLRLLPLYAEPPGEADPAAPLLDQARSLAGAAIEPVALLRPGTLSTWSPWPFAPSPPRLRLSTEGGDLAILAAEARALADEPLAAAVLALLPCALRAGPLPPAEAPSFALRPDAVSLPPAESPLGAYLPCPNPRCAGPCPGLPVGWTWRPEESP